MQTLPRLALFALLPLAACNSNPNPMASTVPQPMPSVPSTTSQDQNFAQQAAMSDMFEIQSSQLAVQQARSPAVRRFAQQMIDAHTATSQKLVPVAMQKGISMPGAMDPMQEQKLAVLRGAGAGFDRAYIRAQVGAHQDAIGVFQTEVRSGTDPDLKTMAEGTVPMIQEHLRMAQRLR